MKIINSTHKVIILLLVLNLTGCLSWYRNFNGNSINSKFRTDGYYTSEKNFTIFDKTTASYAYLRFLDTQNRRLIFSHSKRPISPSGKIIQGSHFKTTYKLRYNSDEDFATLSFSKTVSSFASYTGKLNMIINIKIGSNGYLEGYTFHPFKTTKRTKK